MQPLGKESSPWKQLARQWEHQSYTHKEMNSADSLMELGRVSLVTHPGVDLAAQHLEFSRLRPSLSKGLTKKCQTPDPWTQRAYK